MMTLQLIQVPLSLREGLIVQFHRLLMRKAYSVVSYVEVLE